LKTSTDRILTTHVGSLPRSEAVTRGVFAIDNEEDIDLEQHCREVSAAVAEVVARQVSVGIDVVSDGEMSKLSYATYIKHRVTGFKGDSPRRSPMPSWHRWSRVPPWSPNGSGEPGVSLIVRGAPDDCS